MMKSLSTLDFFYIRSRGKETIVRQQNSHANQEVIYLMHKKLQLKSSFSPFFFN